VTVSAGRGPPRPRRSAAGSGVGRRSGAGDWPYLWWQIQDRKTLNRINLLIRDIVGNGNEGGVRPRERVEEYLVRATLRFRGLRTERGPAPVWCGAPFGSAVLG